jgi:long-chain acyl-CoA synthetase
MTRGNPIRVLADIPRVHTAERPQQVAMVFRGRETNYALLNDRASQVANGLISENLAPQTRIAALDKNSDSFFEVMFGSAKANTVFVAVNWRLSPNEVAYVINDASAEILFVGEEYLDTVEQISASLSTVKKVIALSGRHPEWESYLQWRDRQSAADPELPIDVHDVALQLYTSGTTGHPKGAQLTNANLLSLMPTAVRDWGHWNEKDRSLVCLPLFHIGGSGWASIGFYCGATAVIIHEIDCAEILRLIAEQRVTRAFFVPALLLFLLQTPGVEKTDFSSLVQIVYGASPIPLDLLRAAMATFKCGFAQVYGLTETTGAITYLSPEEHDPNGNPRMRSCGKPHESVDLRIVDPKGEELPSGQVGEIICRTPQNMKGYWNLPEETAHAIRGEWFHTGDAGYLDEDGYLYIHDRLKDMIVSGGENIYPAEIESVIFSHPEVADVAVIGVPDDVWGESVKAMVVRKKGSEVTDAEIIEFTRERIARYKAPRSVDFLEVLPRNPSGKILKRELRAPYWEGRSRQVN